MIFPRDYALGGDHGVKGTTQPRAAVGNVLMKSLCFHPGIHENMSEAISAMIDCDMMRKWRLMARIHLISFRGE